VHRLIEHQALTRATSPTQLCTESHAIPVAGRSSRPSTAFRTASATATRSPAEPMASRPGCSTLTWMRRATRVLALVDDHAQCVKRVATGREARLELEQRVSRGTDAATQVQLRVAAFLRPRTNGVDDQLHEPFRGEGGVAPRQVVLNDPAGLDKERRHSNGPVDLDDPKAEMLAQRVPQPVEVALLEEVERRRRDAGHRVPIEAFEIRRSISTLRQGPLCGRLSGLG
jgi:hypothetical protein